MSVGARRLVRTYHVAQGGGSDSVPFNPGSAADLTNITAGAQWMGVFPRV